MATHSSIPAWEIPWTEELVGLHGVATSQTRLSGKTTATTFPDYQVIKPYSRDQSTDPLKSTIDQECL